ncbi:hypothetical protein KDAU_42900 [Dictyobacter aurantiacus]|uniref:Uncharacterized protein n=1 Tax=Dictyobacter aurantiacus TaxID=1936993 RepID=A0A401ZJC8_9CHLR|nr:hypothetical protein KDAU_42900 [Dictyobacter aurantiacus]
MPLEDLQDLAGPFHQRGQQGLWDLAVQPDPEGLADLVVQEVQEGLAG